mgnify:CR=1 FL=1
MRNKLFYKYLSLVVLFILGGCKEEKEADQPAFLRRGSSTLVRKWN